MMKLQSSRMISPHRAHSKLALKLYRESLLGAGLTNKSIRHSFNTGIPPLARAQVKIVWRYLVQDRISHLFFQREIQGKNGDTRRWYSA